MKKLLIAAAAMSVVAGAQAQSSVEIYGLIDQGYNVIKSSGVADVKQTTVGAGGNSGNGSGNLNGTRLGFRGTEDLGSGLKAGFVVEYGVNLTGAGSAGTAAASESTTGQTLANLRQGYVSLSSANLGTVVAGTVYAFHDATSGAQGGNQAHGGTNNVVGAANTFKYGLTAGSPRATNAIAYISPTFAGVTLKVAKHEGEAVREGAAQTKTNRAVSYAVDYVQGNLKAGFAQTNYKDVNNAATTKLVDVLGSSNDSAAVNTAGLADFTNRVYGGQYNFGFASVGLNHSDFEADSKSNADIKSKQNSLSVSVPVKGTAFTVNAAYTDGKLELDGAKAYDTKAFDLIGVYTLSKRTNVYALAVQTKYENAAAGEPSAKQRQYAVGVRHSF